MFFIFFETQTCTKSDEYVAARKKCGDEGELPFEKFQVAIAKQTEALLAKSHAAAVQYRVEIAGNKVTIKARPVQEDE